MKRKDIEMDERNVKIGTKELVLSNSFGSQLIYFNSFGTNMTNAIKELVETSSKIKVDENDPFLALEGIESLIRIAIKIAYAMAKNKDCSLLSFEDWLVGLGDIDEDIDWVKVVTELSVSSFQRLHQKN